MAKSLLLMGALLVAEMFTAKTPPFHKHIAATITNLANKFIVIVCPRGHAKSSIAAELLVIWHLFFEGLARRLLGLPVRKGPRFVVIWSKTQREAKKRLKTIKSILGDEHGHKSGLLRVLFGDWSHKTARRWTSDEIELRDGTIILAAGMGQQGRGLKNYHVRPTLGILDDPEDENNTKTPESMSDNYNFVAQVAVPGLDPIYGRLVVIGTPLKVGCLVERLFRSEGWTKLWFKNDPKSLKESYWYLPSEDEADGDGFVRMDGVLWEGYRGRKYLHEMRAMLAEKLPAFFREHCAVLVADEENPIKAPEHFYEGSLEWDKNDNPYLRITREGVSRYKLDDLPEPRLVPVLTFVGVDPSRTANATSDPTGIVNIAVGPEGEVFVLWYIHRRIPTGEVVPTVLENHEEVRPERGVFEATAAEFAYQDLCTEGVFYLCDKRSDQSKKVRIAYGVSKVNRRLWASPEHTELLSEIDQFAALDNPTILDALEKALVAAGNPRLMRPHHMVVLEGGEDRTPNKPQRQRALDAALETDHMLA